MHKADEKIAYTLKSYPHGRIKLNINEKISKMLLSSGKCEAKKWELDSWVILDFPASSMTIIRSNKNESQI